MSLTKVTFNDLIVEALTRFPGREAFVDGSRRLTYAQCADWIGRMTAVLARLGVSRGGGVTLLSPNRPEAWLAQAATYLLGAHFSGLHTLGSTGDHVAMCDDAEATVLLADPCFADRAAEIAAQSRTLEHVLTLGPSESAGDLLAWCADVPARALDAGDAGEEDVAWLPYTGGTTGRSKGVMLPQRALVQQVQTIIASWGVPDRPRYLAASPITHAAVVPILPTLLQGGTVVLHRGFDPEMWLRTVQDERISYAFAVPTMIYALLDQAKPEDYDLSSLVTVSYGASPMSPTRLVEAQERIGSVFQQIYGQTETAGVGTMLRKDEHDAKRAPELLGSCGRAVVGARVEILADDGEPVPAGEVGEICIRTRGAMLGYRNLPEQTEETLRHGWVWTGDLGRRDDAGFVYIVDRKKDVIISGGFNVYAREVEDVLTSHADVAGAAVVGVPDGRWGEALKAFVVARPGAAIDERALIDLVKQRKGSHQAPKSVEVIAEFPLTTVGKIDKKVLRAPYWNGQKRQVH